MPVDPPEHQSVHYIKAMNLRFLEAELVQQAPTFKRTGKCHFVGIFQIPPHG